MKTLIRDAVIFGFIVIVIGGAVWTWEHWQGIDAILTVVRDAFRRS